VPTIARAGAEALDQLEPLWLELHHHHQAVGGKQLGPYVTDEVSWPLRRKLYAEVLDGGGFLLLAHDEAGLAAYAVVAVTDAADSLLGDTWRTGTRVAEIETLLVLPRARGAGLGSALLDRVDDELAREGVDDVFIGAVLTNTDAIRLYERRGFRPAWVYMLRLAGAPPVRE
jgi:GNAT superfamily N-acetyltransferase